MIGARIAERNGASAGSSSYSLLNTNGKNGGSADKPFGLWSRFDFTRINDSTAGSKWDANMWNVALGGDYKFNNMFLAGLALTYGYTSGSTKFNNGKIKGDNAFGLAPYINVKANDMFDFDVLGGWSRVNKKRERTPTGGSKVTATAKSNRYFFALAANAHKDISRLSLLGRLGYSYGKDAQKRFTESNGDTYTAQDTKMSRLFMRFQTGYKATEMVMPYLFVTYDHDFSITKHGLADAVAGDTTGYVKPKQNTSNWYGIGGGLQFTSGANWTGGLEYGYKQAAKIKMHNANVRLRYQF
jgi:opacity protein-like surface antigen